MSGDSHATQVAADRWARHGGLGPMVNHSCDPNCGVRLNTGQAFDFVARRAIGAGQELTFDYAMRNFTIDHFPSVCLCGAARCRGSVTGWKDLPAWVFPNENGNALDPDNFTEARVAEAPLQSGTPPPPYP